MLVEERTFNWISVVWSAILIFVLANILASAVPIIYGIYLGFQSQGDMDLVNEGVAAITNSPISAVYIFIVLALIALWRGYVLAKKVDTQISLHAGLAAGGVLLITIVVNLVFGESISWLQLLFQAAAIFGGVYLGAYLLSRKAATPQQS
jgi:uncharacterized membrane protein YedE/YeeE